MTVPIPTCARIERSFPAPLNHAFKNDWYLWLPLALLSWWLAWRLQDPFISDWDGFDYTVYAVQGLPSALGLGRALFLGYNHLLWKLAERFFDLPPESAYLVLRYGAIAQSGVATLGFYALYKELTASRAVACVSALLLATSPYFIIYSGRAMSELPALALLSWALWWLLRSLRLERGKGFLWAALLVGLSANLREFAVFYFPLILFAGRLNWKLRGLALALAVLAAFAGMIFWASYDTDNYLRAISNWYSLSAKERALHPVTLDNIRFLTTFAYECSCAAALLGAPGLLVLCLQRREQRLCWLGVCGLLADLALLFNHDLSVNPRYLLTGMIGLAATAGWLPVEFVKAQRLFSLPLLLGLLVLTKGGYNRMAKELYDQHWNARAAQSYLKQIAALPWRATFIVGARTPLVNYYSGVGAQPFWRVIAPGATWPAEKLGEKIDDALLAGREVFVDFDPQLWQTGARATSRESLGLEAIKREYELEHVRAQLYRIRKRRQFERLMAQDSEQNNPIV